MLMFLIHFGTLYVQKTPPTGKRLHQLQQKNTINTYFGRRGGSSGAGNENSPIVLSGA